MTKYLLLTYTVFLAQVVMAQTCNPNIPLRTPSSDFTDHTNGTITHHRTGLMWKKCVEGQSGTDCTGVPTSITWSQALIHAADHQYAGFSNWRIPNIKELASIVETACYNPALNLSIFPEGNGGGWPGAGWSPWSSSTLASHPNDAWVPGFQTGGVPGVGHKNEWFNLRLVRDSQ